MILLKLLAANWRIVGLIAILVAVGGWIVTLRIERDHARQKAENIQAAFDAFEAKVRVEGEAAKLRVAETNAKSEKAKNEAVASIQSRLDTVTRDRDRLRDARARTGGSVLPAPAGGAQAAANQRAAFDRALLDRALQDFIGEVESLIGEGDAGIVKRDGWRIWYDGQVGARGKD